MFSYKGVKYQEATINRHTGFISADETYSWNVLYPLATHQDVRNKIDHLLHIKECEQMQNNHDNEIKRIFS